MDSLREVYDVLTDCENCISSIFDVKENFKNWTKEDLREFESVYRPLLEAQHALYFILLNRCLKRNIKGDR